MLSTLTRNWWALVLRGLVAVAFGVLLFVDPRIGLAAMIAAFAVYAIVDGVFNVVAALRGATRHERWGMLLTSGLVSLAVGVLALFSPRLTALALLFWIATWAIITGVLAIMAAFRLRKQVKGEWLLGLSGVASIVFGMLAMVYPSAGALAVLLWIGVYAVFFGALLIGLGFRLQALRGRDVLPPDRRVQPPDRGIPLPV